MAGPLSEEQAHALVTSHINRDGGGLPGAAPDNVVVSTLRRPYGWVFSYTTRRWVQTRRFEDGLLGNGPIVVLAADGSLHRLPTTFPLEVAVRRFELEHGLAETYAARVLRALRAVLELVRGRGR